MARRYRRGFDKTRCFLMLTDTTKTHILPYEIIIHPLTGNAIVYTQTVPSQIRIYSRGEVEHRLERNDLDVRRRLLYEKILETYKTQGDNQWRTT